MSTRTQTKLTLRQKVALAGDSRTPEVTLRQLGDTRSEAVLTQLAGNRATPAEVVEDLSRCGIHPVVAKAAKHPKISRERLAELAEDERGVDLVRVAVASNPRTPSEALARLTRTDSIPVRIHVAQNFNATPEILDALFEHSTKVAGHMAIFDSIAANFSASPTLLDRLYRFVISPALDEVVGWMEGEASTRNTLYRISRHRNLAVATLVDLLGWDRALRTVELRLRRSPKHLPHYAVCFLALRLAKAGVLKEEQGTIADAVVAIMGPEAIPPLETEPYELEGYGPVVSLVTASGSLF